MFVVDASLALAWILRDEQHELANQVRARLAGEGLCVPGHWSLEVCNGLLSAARRQRLPADDVPSLARDLRALVDDTDAQTDHAAWTTTLTLAQRHGLTSYDAAYLELAARRRLPLASLERPLLRAVLAEGVEVVPELRGLL
jgi:predicted nucleic acid-binding protein